MKAPIAVWIILGLMVCCELYCCVGMLVLRSIYDKLHCLSAASVCGGVLLAVAILWAAGLSEAGIKSLLASAVLIVTGPILVHVTARAARIQDSGSLAIKDEEME